MPVMTVDGPIDADELGFTLTHEHLQIDLYPVFKNLDLLLNDEALAVEELAAYTAVGGRSVVDLTNRGMRPDPERVRRIARAAGVNVVMGCGWYLQAAYDESVESTSTERLAAEIVRDLTEGIGGTDVRAGIIGEIGTDDRYIKPAEERVFRAAARAHNGPAPRSPRTRWATRWGWSSSTCSKRKASTSGALSSGTATICSTSTTTRLSCGEAPTSSTTTSATRTHCPMVERWPSWSSY